MIVDQQEVKKIVVHAGNHAQRFFRHHVAIDTKNDGSLVTTIDYENNQYLQTELVKLVPGSGCLSEEDEQVVGNEYVWVIDPIDGTKNFAHGVPHFCITVALMQGADVVFGCTYAPMTGDWWYAYAGKGAYVNDVGISIEQQVQRKTVICSGLTCEQIAQVAQAAKHVGYTPRLLGAAALDMAYVASGYADIAILGSMYWWDVAAGSLLITQSGGVAWQQDKQVLQKGYTGGYAGKKAVCEQFYEVLSDHI